MFRRIQPSVIALTLMFAACSSGLEWSEPERRNAQHLVRALDATSAAARLAGGEAVERMSAERRREVGGLLQTARIQAALVDESVLTKAHGELPKRWRREFQPALAALARHYETGHAPAGRDPALRINEFLSWYRSAQPEFRWWPGGPAG